MFSKTLVITLILVVIVAFTGITKNVNATNNLPPVCTEPISLSGAVTDYSRGARLTTDSYGRIHLVWRAGINQTFEGQTRVADTIFYATFEDNQWSQPIDILAHNAFISADKIIITDDDYILLAWRTRQDLFVSRAPLPHASSVQKWETTQIGVRAASSDIFVDHQGRVHLAYTIHEPITGQGRFEYIWSDDSGHGWSQPSGFESFDGNNELYTHIRVYVSENNTIHVAAARHGNEANWSPTGVFYTASYDGGQTWELLEEVSMGLSASFPSFSAGAEPNHLYLLWVRPAGSREGKFYRQSADAGQTWSDSRVLFEGLPGLNGPLTILADSDGIEYVIMSGDTLPAGHTRILYSFRQSDQRWIEPRAVSENLTQSEFPQATIVNGNLLHIVWNDFDFEEIFHIVCELDSPHVASKSIPSEWSDSSPSPQDSILTETERLPESEQALQTSAVDFEWDREPPPQTTTDFPLRTLLIPVLMLAAVILWQIKQRF